MKKREKLVHLVRNDTVFYCGRAKGHFSADIQLVNCVLCKKTYNKEPKTDVPEIIPIQSGGPEAPPGDSIPVSVATEVPAQEVEVQAAVAQTPIDPPHVEAIPEVPAPAPEAPKQEESTKWRRSTPHPKQIVMTREEIGLPMPSSAKPEGVHGLLNKPVRKRLTKAEKKSAQRVALSMAHDDPDQKLGPLCKCGCGERTKGGLFRPGHDAKWHSAQKAAQEQTEKKRR